MPGGPLKAPEKGPGTKTQAASVELTEGLRVLVAEDNLVNQQVAMGLLERWGCDVTVVPNGVEALESSREAASPT